MSDKNPVSIPTRIAISAPRLVRYAFLGGAVGLLVGVCVLFVIAVLYGEAIGLAPGACLLFACTGTMLLSQPVGVAGMLVGAIVGMVAGGVVYYVHHHMPRAL